jgi:16S rRNA (guanine1207-N2)-methyltransferase
VDSERVPSGPTSHYFDPNPSVASSPGEVELTLPDLHVTLRTDRGVFGGAGVDPGTKLLLLEAPAPPADAVGHLLDLGCGYGPIAVALGRRAPAAQVWAVDVNERARALCAENAAAAGLGNVRVVAPDEVPDDVAFAGVWSNPPIRIGKAALHDLLLRWLDRLTPAGRAWLVVHKHLGSDSLARWLEQQGHPTARLTSRAGYRILAVQPAPGA